ncbi:MAG: hypothetical protein U1F36_10075 [Planctomycetota bacterium]
MVAALRRCAKDDPRYPRTLLFSQASVEATTTFLASRWPDASAVCDPTRAFYAEFARRRARLGDLLSFGALRATLRALLRGHGIGRVVGDPRQMPGILVVQDRRILWDHPFAHAGDHPDFAAIPRLAGISH